MPNCKLPECPIATGGRCLEGRAEDCPNLITEPVVSTDATVNDDIKNVPIPNPEMIPLYSGLPLEIGEAREISSRGRAVVVSLAGMIDSGKTSLLARLHQLFQAGPIGDYSFAGSRTLLRFEELNWMATIESGVAAPKMEHSSRRYDNTLLHFTIQRLAERTPQVDILLNDISGETYPDAITAESVCRQLACLQRADHLGIVVDGAAIANRDLRHDHCAKAKNFVQRVLQTGQVGKGTILHLIFTKMDVLVAGDQRDENEAAAKRLEDDFASLFSGKVADINVWRVAARPRDGSMPTEAIITQLFQTWVGSTNRYAFDGPSKVAATQSRDFDLFGR
jgi:hypothetical protein